jgi:hypothetical protein
MSGISRPTITFPADEAERLRQLVVQLNEKLAGQPVIEQAKGMLMQTFGLSADEAFEILRELSQHSNVKLRSVAQRIVLSWTRRGPRADFDVASEFLRSLRSPVDAPGRPQTC